jgi:NADPH-dependent 2,4-dienoyl-CoA reductase/sulfur reductase-like enzyme
LRSRKQQIVIVGAGRAGVAAAEELRTEGFAGEVVVLHDEEHEPYDRPACATGLLTGHRRPRDVRMPITQRAGITWQLGRRAAHLAADEQVVVTADEEVYEYDGLVIASGARAVPPPGWPIGAPGLHLLYRLDDAWRLRGDLRDARRVAVVGAGMTGCEVASAVRELGRECVLIDPAPVVMGRPLGEVAAAMMTEELGRQGVVLRLGRMVRDLAAARQGWQLTLDDGEQIHVDVVVASTGERPDTAWLEETPGLDVTDGVLCDARLRVVGASNVVAAGTVARWPNLHYSHQPTRIGGGRDQPAMTHVPRFWSDQFGIRIQVCGVLPAQAEMTVTELRPGRRDAARSGTLIGYHVDGALVAVVALNAPRAFTSLARGLLATRAPGTAPLATATAGPARRRLAAVG